jgi:hypothetical protein
MLRERRAILTQVSMRLSFDGFEIDVDAGQLCGPARRAGVITADDVPSGAEWALRCLGRR